MNHKKKTGNHLVHIGDLLPEIISSVRRPDTELLRVWDLWEEIVGTAVAGNAKPAAFKGDIIIVHVSSSTWVHHLQFVKQDIINRINEAFGETRVRDIRFKIGDI